MGAAASRLHPHLQDSLIAFAGRPNLFVEGVWTPLVGYVIDIHGVPSKADSLALLAGGRADLITKWGDTFYEYIESAHAKCIEKSDGSATHPLLPLLVESILMNDGVVVFGHLDQQKEALCKGILAVSSSSVTTVDMKQEAIIFEALKAQISAAALRTRSAMLDLLLHTRTYASTADRGTKLELAVAWHMALAGLTSASSSSVASGSGRVTLVALLRTFGTSVASELPPCLEDWVFNASRIRRAPKGVAAMALLCNIDSGGEGEGEDGLDLTDKSPNSSIIVIDTPTELGVDVAFAVQSAAGGNHALVTLRCRDAPVSATEALLCLQPGSQFLDNDIRVALRDGSLIASIRKTSKESFMKYESLSRAAAGTACECLFDNWIRIPVVPYKRTPNLETLSYELSKFGASIPKLPGMDVAGTPWTAEERDSVAESPVVWVFMHEVADTPGLFNLPIFSSYVKKDLVRDTSVSTLSVDPDTVSQWLPISIDAAAARLEYLPIRRQSKEQQPNSALESRPIVKSTGRSSPPVYSTAAIVPEASALIVAQVGVKRRRVIDAHAKVEVEALHGIEEDESPKHRRSQRSRANAANKEVEK